MNFRFDDKVVNSFSDHMVTHKVDLIHDLFYNIDNDQLRVTVLIDGDELGKLKAIDKLIEFQDSSKRKAAGDVPIVGIDASFKVYNQNGEVNSVLLAFNELKTYRFWRDGKNSDAEGDEANIKVFKKYISDSVQGVSGDDKASEIKALEEKLNALKQAGSKDFEQMFRLQERINLLKEGGSHFSTVEDKFSTQISFKPKFIGSLIQYLSKKEVFNKYLELSHYHLTEGAGEEAKVVQLVKVDRIDRALQLALPDVEINYIKVEDRQMVFTGRVTK